MSEPFSLQYNQNIRVTIAGTDQKLRTFLGMDSNHTGDFNEPGLWPLVLYEEVNGKQKVVPPDRVFLEQLENLFDNLAPERGISDPPDPPPAWFVSALPKSVQSVFGARRSTPDLHGKCFLIRRFWPPCRMR
ncbi:MAG: hypothetical protein IPM84_17865 [Anaerolineae bacterium]|nr:hypothetical protein [Anaerolineae bacterium]